MDTVRVNPPRPDVGAALLALAMAVQQGLTADRPEAVDIHANSLSQQQVRALFFGMAGPVIDCLRHTGGEGEDVQILGTILGRAYRVLLVGRDHAGTLGTLQMVLIDRARGVQGYAVTA